jgi:hypothetical protein
MQITADLLRSKFGFNDPNVINNILNNPAEVQRYTREAGLDPAWNAEQAANRAREKAKAETIALNQAQQAREQDFLTRFRTAIPEARTALESELGLPTLRSNVLTAGDTARNVQDQFGAIAPTQQTIAKQVGISAPRLQQRIASKSAELAPALSAASSSMEGANQALQSGLATYGTRMGETLKPYETEASVLSESLAREMTGFTTNLQSELETSLERIRQQGATDLAEIQKATRLAEMEQQYLNQRELVDLGGSKNLINPITGQTISTYKNTGTLSSGW